VNEFPIDCNEISRDDEARVEGLAEELTQ